MRVVYVSTLERGGPVSHLQTLVPHVAAEGVEVRILCQSESVAKDFEALGVPAWVTHVSDKFDVLGAARIFPELRSADIVHTHDRRAGLFARPLARLRGAQVVHTFHGLPEEIAVGAGRASDVALPGTSRLRVAWLVHGYLGIESGLARLGMIITPSTAMAQFLVRHGLPRERIEVVPSGMDVRHAHPRPLHAPVRVGTVTNLEPWKGVDVLLSACGLVEQPLRLEVYGEGSERPALERRARALGLDARFHGYVPSARECLEELDVFVLPSRAENLPISVLEAMASAVPVIAARVGGVPELVIDGETGVLVEPEDAMAIATAIETLIEEPDLREALAGGGARRVREKFDPGELARKMIRLYGRLCESST